MLADPEMQKQLDDLTDRVFADYGTKETNSISKENLRVYIRTILIKNGDIDAWDEE